MSCCRPHAERGFTCPKVSERPDDRQLSPVTGQSCKGYTIRTENSSPDVGVGEGLTARESGGTLGRDGTTLFFSCGGGYPGANNEPPTVGGDLKGKMIEKSPKWQPCYLKDFND